MKMQRLDSIPLDETYYTDEGYLVDHPIVTTCGIFEYTNADGSTRRELRLPEDVFDEKSLKSYKGKPIIITHDVGEVDKDNVRDEQIGTIMSEGYRDGDNVRCEIIIHDTNSLKKCGLRELSLGYSLDTEDTPGEWNGEKYDCIQRNIEINHLALVGTARAGETARLNIDSKDDDNKILKGGKLMLKPNETGSRTDGAEGLSPEELEAAIALYKAQQAAASAGEGEGDGEGEEESKIPDDVPPKSPIEQVRENIDRRDSDANMSPEDVIKAQKADLETLLSEIDKLQATNDMSVNDSCEENTDEGDNGIANEADEDKDKGVNMDSVDKIVQERIDVCRMADKLNLDGIDKLSVTEGRKAIIKAVNPKMNLDGKSESYITAAYDIAKETFNSRVSTDAQRQKIAAVQMHNDAKEESNSATARKNMINRMTGGNE